jgi:very-short-patch-repair endonuclease
MNNHYNKNLKFYARELRTQSVSRAEKYIWKSLLSRCKTGVNFKRQRPIQFFIVDFFSQEVGLIIEIDGNSHVLRGGKDKWRQDELLKLGYTILRFSEGEVIQNIDNVEEQIRYTIYCLKERLSSPSIPLQRGKV